MKTKEMVICALMTALICVISPISIPLPGGVPLSLATGMILLSGAVLKSKRALLCTALYIFLGCIGLPVFAGYKSGFANLFGPTGGYLVGYLPLAFFTGWIYEHAPSKKMGRWYLLCGMGIGELCLYFLGTVWFIFIAQTDVWSALLWCVLPFLPLDFCKMVAVVLLTPWIERVLTFDQ